MLRRTRLNPISKKRRDRSISALAIFKTTPSHPREAFKTFPDGREVCYTVGSVKQSLKGRKEYRRRIEQMLARQRGICCLHGHAPMCLGLLALEEATFEHENGRGGGKRDDRIEVEGRWINGAAHYSCNNWKGSRRIDYNSSLQGRERDAQGD